MELLNFIQMFFFVCCVAIGTIEYDRWWKHMSYSYIVTVNIILQTNKSISIVIERGRGVLGSGNKSKQSLLQLDAVASALRKK